MHVAGMCDLELQLRDARFELTDAVNARRQPTICQLAAQVKATPLPRWPAAGLG